MDERYQIPPLMEYCPVCGGTGVTIEDQGKTFEGGPCKHCINGKAWRYYTPAQFIQWYKDNDYPVHELVANTAVWELYQHAVIGPHWKLTTLYAVETPYRDAGIPMPDTACVLAIPGQPKPPKEYRP